MSPAAPTPTAPSSETARQAAWDAAAGTPDPELPMLTVADLGILRTVEVEGARVVATITPTYSGCPAMREIGTDVRHRLQRRGFDDVEVRFQLTPAWSSDWITDEGRRKLAGAGIAPPSPAGRRSGPVPLTLGPPPAPPCPHCGSARTRRSAEFGATACRSLHRCESCREPFEAVKAI